MSQYQVTEIEKRRRTFGGRIVATLFYGFHVLMLATTILLIVAEDFGNSFSAVLTLWVLGTIGLGVLMLCSRGERVVVRHEERLDNEPADS